MWVTVFILPTFLPTYQRGQNRIATNFKTQENKKDPEFQGLYGPYGTLKIYLMAGNTGFEPVV